MYHNKHGRGRTSWYRERHELSSRHHTNRDNTQYSINQNNNNRRYYDTRSCLADQGISDFADHTPRVLAVGEDNGLVFVNQMMNRLTGKIPSGYCGVYPIDYYMIGKLLVGDDTVEILNYSRFVLCILTKLEHFLITRGNAGNYEWIFELCTLIIVTMKEIAGPKFHKFEMNTRSIGIQYTQLKTHFVEPYMNETFLVTKLIGYVQCRMSVLRNSINYCIGIQSGSLAPDMSHMLDGFYPNYGILQDLGCRNQRWMDINLSKHGQQLRADIHVYKTPDCRIGDLCPPGPLLDEKKDYVMKHGDILFSLTNKIKVTIAPLPENTCVLITVYPLTETAKKNPRLFTGELFFTETDPFIIIV